MSSLCCMLPCAGAVAAQDAGVRALAADTQRVLMEDLVIAAAALSPPEAARTAIAHLLGDVVREVCGLAGDAQHRSLPQHASIPHPQVQRSPTC